MSYTYVDQTHKHAVTALSNGNTYSYDADGNMTGRHVYEGGNWKNYTLTYDAENHMTSVSGDAAASFGYDGDGKRITATEGITTTVYVGNFLEWAENTSTHLGVKKSYYYAGSTRVAMRTGSSDPQFLLGDHLGSTSKILNYNGTDGAADRGYKPWGEVRLGLDDYPTGYQFTGQYRQKLIGLYYFGARWYDSSLGRFSQPDTVIPDKKDPQAWDRYSYVFNNPLRYIDPSGHAPCIETDIHGTCITVDYALKHLNEIGEVPEGLEPDEFTKDLFYKADRLRYWYEQSKKELTTVQIIGQAATVLLVVLLLTPVELYFFYLAFALAGAGLLGGIVDGLIIFPLELVLSDFQISLLLNLGETIDSGHNVELEWTILPAISSEFPESFQKELHQLFPGIFP